MDKPAIASKLRYRANEGCKSPLNELKAILGMEPGASYRDVFRALAELIEEETCEALPVEAGDQFRRCSNCGFDGWCDQESVTSYCPECGAKVVKGE
jgi:predicted Zn-ribbon and HTH transcriptional regulator